MLQTPLMVWLTRTIYAEADTTPGELVPLALDGDREAIERHLISKLIHAVYTPGDFSSTAAKWKPESAEAWLRFVARHLQAEDSPTSPGGTSTGAPRGSCTASSAVSRSAPRSPWS